MTSSLQVRSVSPQFIAYNPPDMDGTTTVPENYKLLGKTKYAKAVDVVVLPNTAEKPHTHGLRSIHFIDRPTARTEYLVNQQAQEKLLNNVDQTPPASSLPVILYRETEPLYYMRNNDSEKSFRAIRIELKVQPKYKFNKDQDNASSKVPGKKVELAGLAEDVIVWDIEVKPGTSAFLQTYNSAGILVSCINTAVKVWNYVNTQNMTLVPPYKNVDSPLERPKVWPVAKQSSYQLLNDNDLLQHVYFVEIKA